MLLVVASLPPMPRVKNVNPSNANPNLRGKTNAPPPLVSSSFIWMERTKKMDFSTNDVAITMAAVLGTMVAVLGGLVMLQKPKDPKGNDEPSTFLPSKQTQPSKYAYEMYALYYTPIWIACFGAIVVGQLYEEFTATTYNMVCGGLAMPLLLQPLLLPSAGFQSPDQNRPLSKRYATKANLWLVVFAFIGTYVHATLFLCKPTTVAHSCYSYQHYSQVTTFSPTTFTRYSRQNTPCRPLDSTMFPLPCFSPHTFTFPPITSFPIHSCERPSQPFNLLLNEPCSLLALSWCLPTLQHSWKR